MESIIEVDLFSYHLIVWYHMIWWYDRNEEMQSIRSLAPKEMPEKVMKAKFIYKVGIVVVKETISFSVSLSLYLYLPLSF